MNFLESYSTPELIFFWLGLVSTIGFALQTGLSFIGIEGGDDFDTDTDIDDGGDFSVFTIKNLIIFLMIFGWAGLVCIQSLQWSVAASIFGAVSLATLIVIITTSLFFVMSKMKHDGTLKIENCLGKTGNVYLRIPPDGLGKVSIAVQGALRDFDAVSKKKVNISTGMSIKVVGIQDNAVLEVESI